MPEPLVLISHRMLAGLQPMLEQAGLQVRRAWELDAADRPAVRAVLHAGEFMLTPDVLGAFPNLGLVAVLTAGYEGVDVRWCRAHGVEVTYAGGVNADDVADHAMGLMIAGWRDMMEGDRIVREGRWRLEDRLAPQPSLTGRMLGIVGLGHIGAAIAHRAEACRLNVAWWGPRPKLAPWPMADTLLELAQASDILAIACPGGRPRAAWSPRTSSRRWVRTA